MTRTKIVMGWLAAVVSLAAVILVACSSSDPAASPAPDGKAQSCTPGQQTSCTCAGGATGFQVCDANGASFGSCQCSSDETDAASSADTGGSDAGGDTGSGDTGTDAAVPIPTNGLVAYYRGDGVDKSGNFNQLTGGMTLTTDRFGGTNAGKILASADAYLSIATHPLIPTGSQPFSISVWGRYLSAGAPLLQWGNKPGSVGGNSLGLGPQVGTKTLSSGTWHHIVLTFDGTNERLFINNTLDSSTQGDFGSSSPARFGMGNDCGLNYPPICGANGGAEVGSIDDVRVYSRVLTVPEIDALYHEVK